MGGSQSSLPPAPLGCEYMCIAIREPDKLRIILGTDQEANIVRQIIQESWPMGIQKESFKLNGVYKFKLKGWPFETSSLTEAVHCRQMAERILHRLHRNGWHLQISCDLTQTKDLSTWFFRKVPEVTNFSSQPFLVVGLSSSDSLMVLNAPVDLHQLLKNAISKSWPSGIQKWSYENDVLLIKLKGFPWCPDGSETVHSRVVLQAIIHDLSQKQWHLYGNSNLKSTANTLFFKYEPDMSSSSVSHPLPPPWHFTFHGFPWCPDGSETVHSRVVLQAIIHDLSQKQWHLYGNSNLKSTANTLFFKYEPDMSSSSVSHPLPPPWHFTLSLNSNDLLRVIDAPESLIPTIRDIIQTSWYRGIQGVLRYAGSWEFKLKGTPWWADGQETVEARILILKLMEMLHAVGWSPIASIDSSRKVSDKSSLIFRQSQPRQSPFFCLSLHKTDTLRLINAHEDVARVCCKCN